MEVGAYLVYMGLRESNKEVYEVSSSRFVEISIVQDYQTGCLTQLEVANLGLVAVQLSLPI